jgi:hypothetical protein
MLSYVAVLEGLPVEGMFERSSKLRSSSGSWVGDVVEYWRYNEKTFLEVRIASGLG